MKRLFYMAVSYFHFKCKDTWYVQKEGLAMGASLTAILPILWLKDYEKVLAMDIPQKIDILKDMNGKFPKCNRKMTFRTKAVECQVFLNWYHKNCDGISEED